MKKIIIASALLMTSSFAFAHDNGTMEIPKQQASDEVISIIKLNKNTIMEVKFDKKLDTCYVRVCKTVSVDQGDGTSVEVKQCSDWQQVPCPTGPQPPSTQL